MKKRSIPQVKHRAWDEKTKQMRTVLSVSFDEEYVIFKDAPDKKMPMSEVVLLRYMGICNENRKHICEGDIIDFVSDAEINRAIVKRQGDEWSFHIVNTENILSQPWMHLSYEQLKQIVIVGNIYQDKDLLSEKEIRKKRVLFLKAVLGDTCSYLSVRDEDFCRHDIQKAFDNLSTLTNEELIDIIQSLSETLKYYKKEYFDQLQRSR